MNHGRLALLSTSLVIATALQAADFTGFPPTEAPYGYIAPITVNDFNISDGDAKLYRPWFHNAYHYGDLRSHAITAGGAVGATVLWSAMSQLENQVSGAGWSSRKLFTNSGASGANFGCGAASPSTAVQFHCGNHAVENGTTVRQRQYTVSGATSSFTLGDIIHSAPVYVGVPDAALPSSSYLSFANTWKNRAPRVYVGSNDGFMHAFNAATGDEVWAFTPALLSSKLTSLTSPSYTHDYAVDGPTVVRDAYADFDGDSDSEWRTALVGALGAGGKGLYALDVTDPDADNKENPTGSASSLLNKFLWEFTSADDPDLGYTYAKPVLAKLANGEWGVITGNGYNNSGDGKAHLFVLSLEDSDNNGRADIIADIPLGSSTSNGLSSPAVVDLNGDGVADRIYAGDLEGNLWKINIGDATPSNWSSTVTTIFTTSDANGNAQPILVAPEVAKNTSGTPIVIIGTGDHLLDGDYLNASVAYPSTGYRQSLYGIIDDGTISVAQTRANLATPISFSNIGSSDYRTIVANTASARGWTVDLAAHEHVLQDMVVRDGRLQLMINDRTPNAPKNWLSQIDFATGGLPAETVFDLNADGMLDSNDDQSGQRVVAINKTADLASRPLIAAGASNDHSFINIWDANVASATPGPVSCSMLWIDIRYQISLQKNDKTNNGTYWLSFNGYLDDGSTIDITLENMKYSLDSVYKKTPCDNDAYCVHGNGGVSNLDGIDLNFNHVDTSKSNLSSTDVALLGTNSGNGSNGVTGAKGLRWDPTHIDLHRSNESFAIGIQFDSNLRLDNYTVGFGWSDDVVDETGNGDPQFVRRIEVGSGACNSSFSVGTGRVLKDGEVEDTIGGIAGWDNAAQSFSINNPNGNELVFNPSGDSAAAVNGAGVVVDGTTDQTSQNADDSLKGRVRWRELTF